jgi:putative endonuclease
MASGRHGTLYLGVSLDAVRRASLHRQSPIRGFTASYVVKRLVWFGGFEDIALRSRAKRTSGNGGASGRSV